MDLKEIGLECEGVDQFDVVQDKQYNPAIRFCEHGNELSVTINGG
jgi:hypothetical protein